MLIRLSIFLAVLLVGCAARGPAPQQFTAAETRIVDAARREVARQGWGKATFERPERRPGGGWSVLGWSVPAKPGGHWVFIIDDHERVVHIMPGA
jgi:hypothetical protein